MLCFIRCFTHVWGACVMVWFSTRKLPGFSVVTEVRWPAKSLTLSCHNRFKLHTEVSSVTLRLKRNLRVFVSLRVCPSLCGWLHQKAAPFFPSHLLTFVAGIWCSLRAALPASLRLDTLLATFKRLKKSVYSNNNNKTTVLILSLLIQEMLYNCFFSKIVKNC